MSNYDVPWFMFSPSPTSLAQYAILTLILSCHLYKSVQYSRFPRFFSLVDGFMVMAFFVTLTDAFWAGWCALKWLPMFPGSTIQILSSFGRDLVAAALFLLLTYQHFKSRVLEYSRKVIFWLLISLFAQMFWFWIAPSPAYTDYTFAWRWGYPLEVVIFSFILSHFFMRIPLWLSIWYSRRIDGDT